MRVPAASAGLLGRNVILEVTPFETRESRSGRGPMRVFASDADGNTISLDLSSTIPGGRSAACRWARSASFRASSKQYGDEWQIIHPEVAEPGQGPQPAIREPVYPLTEGLTNRRMGELAREAIERAPELPEWIEPSLRRARMLARRGGPRLPKRIASPARMTRRRRLAYDEIFANQLALLLLRQSSAAPRGRFRCRARAN